MGKIVIELTNRCNLKCHHCFSGRHGGKDDIPTSALENIWRNAQASGFNLLSFTGGDPTIHPDFTHILERTVESGFNYGVNTNGINFRSIYPVFKDHSRHCKLITFSMDGGSETTHDQLRGKNSFRRLMQAISICVVEKIPFAINMVIAAHNRHELMSAVQLATNAGARGIRFCHLMHSPITTEMNLDLSPWERKLVDAEVALLKSESAIQIEMAPGDYTTNLFPCAPLAIEEVNVDCNGNLTTCCHLSGHGPDSGNDDVIGSLNDEDFGELLMQLETEHKRFHKAKKEYFAANYASDTDFFSCWYCTNFYKKTNWLRKYKQHTWSESIWNNANTDSHDSTSSVIPIFVDNSNRS